MVMLKKDYNIFKLIIIIKLLRASHLTHMKVPGKKTIVMIAIVFIDELSRKVLSAMIIILSASLLEASAIICELSVRCMVDSLMRMLR